MSRYRGNPEAIAALVQDDQVHRDVYIDPEIFELEMEQLWSSTWIYVGHVSQVPRPGDYVTIDIATRPMLMVHSNYAPIPGYDEVMIGAYGEQRAREILGTVRHNTVY